MRELAFPVFQEIRELDGIDNNQILESLSPAFNRDMVFKAGGGGGRSGSFFFFSHDRKFVIKTMFEKEVDVMMSALPEYYDHI